jgi:S-adenosylmethionine synthetase
MPQLYAAEAVLPGHPDKLCDAVADALVEEAARREKRALCRVAVACHRERVLVSGRIACRDAETIDVAAVVREAYRSAGHDDAWGPAPGALRVEADLCLGPLGEGADRRGVAEGPCVVVGYAVDRPGLNHLPPEQWLAARLRRRLERLRAERPDLKLGPDGKLLVLLEEDEHPTCLAGLSVALQQAADGPQGPLQRAVRQVLTDELAELSRRSPGCDGRPPESVQIVGAGGRFGGPAGDSGLSGRQVIADAYGPRVPSGGAALSGKDLFQAERAGTLLARRLAKAAVLTGAARECRATLAFVPGQSEAQVVALVGDGRLLDASRWGALLDRSLAAAGERYTNAASLVEVARHGLFTDEAALWERVHFDDR